MDYTAIAETYTNISDIETRQVELVALVTRAVTSEELDAAVRENMALIARKLILEGI